MKNLKQIKKQIANTEKSIRDRQKDPYSEEREKGIRKLQKELLFMREIEKYLEFEPREEFCKEEKERLERITKAAYDSWNTYYQQNREAFDKLPMKNITERKNKFLKDIDLSLMKNQIRTLDFILS